LGINNVVEEIVHNASDNMSGVDSCGVTKISRNHEVEHGREIATVLAVMLRITMHDCPLRV
jgi:hypothetical protein